MDYIIIKRDSDRYWYWLGVGQGQVFWTDNILKAYVWTDAKVAEKARKDHREGDFVAVKS